MFQGKMIYGLRFCFNIPDHKGGLFLEGFATFCSGEETFFLQVFFMGRKNLDDKFHGKNLQ